ncbi:MAG: hypothetical protein OZ921_04700 [Sorangiineae bacterium]|nr:hypothetical protein [Polyangiaceae bacterium]MEB2321791.1 hypothetical protein [Sorangiineae bacterium]
MRTLPLAVFFVWASGCSGAPPKTAEPLRPPVKGRSGAGTRGAPGGLPATLIGMVGAGTYGPYLGRRDDALLAVWAARSGESGKRGWYTIALDPRGRPLAEAARIGDAPAEPGLVAVRPSGGEGTPNPVPGALEARGFLLLATERGQGGTRLYATSLGTRGELRGGPSTIATSGDDLVWIDAVPTRRSTLAVWAVRRESHADVYAAEIGLASERIAAAELVVQGARAWQVAPLADGAAVAAVTSASGGATGTVEVVYLDQAGKPSRPLEVSGEPTAAPDLDMVSTGSGLTLAWSDGRGLEEVIYTARVDARGGLARPPAPLTPPSGEQALLRLVTPLDEASPAWVAWEELAASTSAHRRVELATLTADGQLGSAHGALRLAPSDGGVPELASMGGGLGALVLAPACREGERCADAELLPTFVAFDAEARPVATEPLRLAALGGKGADLAWGLTCGKHGCGALAATSTSPAPLYAVNLDARTGAHASPGEQVVPGPPPRVVSNQAVAALDPLAEVTAARVGDTTLAAWVSYFDPTTPWRRLTKPAPDGRFEPLRARVEVRAFPDGKEPLPTRTVSLRGRSLGGVALAPGDPAKRQSLLAWTALDNQLPQVFVTLLAEDGKTVTQRMLTRTKGEVSDVAAAWVGDGYVVGWIDERDDDPEVYVAKLGPTLQSLGPERRVTRAKGAATGLALAAQGRQLLAVWADARDGAKEGWADLFAARLSTKDAAPLGVESLLMKTPAHSRSPALAPFGDGTAIAWIESRPGAGLDDESPGLYVGQLDRDGRLNSSAELVEVPAGAPSSVALECESDRCHVVVGVDARGAAELRGFTWQPGTHPAPSALTAVSGPAGEPLSPAMVGRELFFADQSASGKGRVRRLLIDWK